MHKFETRELKKNEYNKWDELVENSQYGTIFHSSNWLTACSELFNKKLKIYGCFKKDELVGGCSLYNYRSGVFKIASSITAMTPYGGVVVAESNSSKIREKEQIFKGIILSLCKVFDEEHFNSIKLVNSPDFVDVRPFTWNGWESKIHYAYYFNLKDDIGKKVSKKVRNTVRKAIKNNITIKKLNDASIFYDLFSITYKRQNLNPPVTKDFFERIIHLVKSNNIGEMWIAETPNGRPASAEIVIWDNKRAYRWSAASHDEFKDTGAPSLLLYEIFNDLKKRGFEEINLMAANTRHLAKFISSFNPKLVTYYTVEKKTGVGKILEGIYQILK